LLSQLVDGADTMRRNDENRALERRERLEGGGGADEQLEPKNVQPRRPGKAGEGKSLELY